MAVFLTKDSGCDVVRLREAVKSDLSVIDLSKKIKETETAVEQAEAALGDLAPRLKREVLKSEFSKLDRLYRDLEKFQQRAEDQERKRQKLERLQLLRIAAADDMREAALHQRNFQTALKRAAVHQRRIQSEGGSLFDHPFDADLINRMTCKVDFKDETGLWAIAPN